MTRALILGGTGKQSLGREIALTMLTDGITPILVGRTAQDASRDPTLKGCEFVTADLMDLNVAQKVLSAVGNLHSINYLVVAGGGPHLRGNLVTHPLDERRRLWRTIVEGPIEIVSRFHAGTMHPYCLITVASTSATVIRKDETIYATAQAARRSFALNFHAELSHRFGCQNFVFCPGGMQTGLWTGSDTDTSQFMDPVNVATTIWYMVKEKAIKPSDMMITRGKKTADGQEQIIVTVMVGNKSSSEIKITFPT